jgi:DNA-binding Xre family transcriptional regulator
MPPKPELSSNQRKMIVSELLLRLKPDDENKKLRRGALTEVANLFAINPRTTARIWKRARRSYQDPAIGAFRASPRKSNSGRKQKYDRDAVREAIALVPIEKRKTLRKLSAATGIPLSSLHAMKQDKEDSVILSHSNALKPHLEDHHKFARVLYSISNLDLDTEEYADYFDSVHVDEKWFF